MYQYIWDTETGGLLLTTEQSKFSKEPRPVYYKELDILGFDKYWKYPKDDSAPIMWAEANNYIYRGRTIAKTKGGALYSCPKIVVLDDSDEEELQLVDVKRMVEKNGELLEGFAQETIQKIYNTYREYKEKIDVFYVAFSGGKDSIVALDLVQRALPHNEFIVLFGDTGMEFSDTYKTVDLVRDYCKGAEIEFHVAKSEYNPLDTWKKFGPPSTVTRWCCSVHKTAPQILKLRELLQKPDFTGTNFEKQAIRCLNEWKQKISAGAFMLYTSDNRSGVRLAGIQALQDELKAVERKKYYYGLSQYSVIDNMFAKGPLAQGAECGINQALAGTFKSSNEKNSLANALTGAWGIDEYWKDPSKKSLAIVRIKNKVEELVQQGFSNAAGRVSILSIFEALEDAPYGFIPSNIAAFVMGFVLKEYAVSDYFWSNGSNSESMSVDKMKQMIANALNQKVTPNRNYKEEYIVEMSSEQKAFLSCTAKVFNIANAQCGSIESARDQIRSRMKQLTFPIWCVKSLLATENLSSSIEDISEVIDCYCGIANTANSTKSSESDLADVIGRKINADSNIVDDLTKLITNEKCKAGMLVYIRNYRTGLLETLALEVDDNGAYIDQVKQKFNADAANWVWNSETADEKIDDVILEYQIIVESNKLNPRALSLHDAVIEWNKRSSNIRISFEALRKYAGTLEGFLEQLLLMQRSGSLQEQNKSKFYDCLLAEGNNFIEFYKNQIQYFKQVASTFIEDLDEQDIDKLYFDIPNGQFTKSSTEYFNYIEGQVKVFLQNQAKRKLLTLWKDKTGTKNPADWSNTYQTPIYCMFSDEERNNVRVMFKPFGDKAATEEMVTRTIAYLEKADFYERLSDAEERNRCFKQRVIGDYSVILTDVDEIRDYLVSHVTEAPHAWFDNSTVRNKLKSLCEKQYLLKGKDTAMEVINNMDADEAKKYLCDLIADNPTVGMEIIKNRKG